MTTPAFARITRPPLSRSVLKFTRYLDQCSFRSGACRASAAWSSSSRALISARAPLLLLSSGQPAVHHFRPTFGVSCTALGSYERRCTCRVRKHPLHVLSQVHSVVARALESYLFHLSTGLCSSRSSHQLSEPASNAHSRSRTLLVLVCGLPLSLLRCTSARFPEEIHHHLAFTAP